MIEIITVIAIIAIMLAMIIPLAGGARRQFAITQTKARFHRYSLALEQFKSEYGSYPNLGASPISINTPPARFVQLMTGKNLSGGAIDDPVAAALNSKGLSFLQFSADEITTDGQLVDGFGGTNITLYFDADGDGFLDNLTNIRGNIGWQAINPNLTISSWK